MRADIGHGFLCSAVVSTNDHDHVTALGHTTCRLSTDARAGTGYHANGIFACHGAIPCCKLSRSIICRCIRSTCCNKPEFSHKDGRLISRQREQRLVITGAGGFVGRHLAQRLVATGAQVIASDLRDPGIAGAQFVACDVTDRQACNRLVAEASVVFHVASMVQTRQSGAAPVWAVNHGGTQNLLAASQAAKASRFVYVSSASVVYQGTDIENGDESLPYAAQSQAPYADSKIAAEREVLAANGQQGLLTCAVRPHVIYGPGDGRFLPAILRRARAGTLRYGVGRENKLSDFTYIDN